MRSHIHITSKSRVFLIYEKFSFKTIQFLENKPLGLFLFEVNMNPSLSENEKITEIDAADELIIQSLAKLDSVAMGVSVGILFGLIIFLATNFLIIKGGENVGQNLVLLRQYFFKYEVTPVGSLIGFLYGFFSGFILGWLGATIRNIMVTTYLNVFKLKRKMSAVNDFIDNP